MEHISSDEMPRPGEVKRRKARERGAGGFCPPCHNLKRKRLQEEGRMIPEISGDFLQWLRGFYYVATSGSLSRAAHILHRSQSSVTYQIQSLEKALDNVLFVRVGNRLIPTASGEALLRWTIRTFDVVSGLHGALACSDGVLRGTVLISGTRPTFRMPYFMRALKDCLHVHPDVHVQLLPGYPDELIDDLERGKNDFSVLGLVTFPATCAFLPLFEAPQMLAVARAHPYALDPVPTAAQLAGLPYIHFIRPRSDKPYSSYFFSERLNGLMKTRSALSCSNYQTILEYVADGWGCAVIDAWSLLSFPHLLPRLAVYYLRDALPGLRYGVLMRKKSPLSPPAKALVGMITGALRGLDLTNIALDHPADPLRRFSGSAV